MQIGVDSFAAAISDPATGLTLSPVDRIRHLLEEIELADRVGHRQAGSYEAGPSDYNSTAKRVSRQCVISWLDADFPALIKAVLDIWRSFSFRAATLRVPGGRNPEANRGAPAFRTGLRVSGGFCNTLSYLVGVRL
jgi:hypothetical protein